MNKRIVCALLAIVLASTAAACSSKDKTQETAPAASESQSEKTEDKKEKDKGPGKSQKDSGDNASADDTSAEPGLERYNSFLNGEEPVYFDNFLSTFEDSAFWSEQFDMIEKGKAYSLEEFADVIAQKECLYWNDDYYMDEVCYSYIDCGDDGVPELAVYFGDIRLYESGWNVITVIKEIDDRLQICDYEEYSDYSDLTINQKGYITLTADNEEYYASKREMILDKDAEAKWICNRQNFYTTRELYVPGVAEINEKAEQLGVANRIMIQLYYIGDYIGDYESQLKDSVYVYGKFDENKNLITSDDYYRPGSPYYKLMDYMGVKTVKPDKIEMLRNERCEKIGATDAILNAPAVEWAPFYYCGIVSDPSSYEKGEYVGRRVKSVYVDNPSWEYYCAASNYPYSIPVTLTKVSDTANEIIDDYEWFESIGIPEPQRFCCEDEYYEYYLSGDDYAPFIIQMYNKYTGEEEAEINMYDFVTPPRIAKGDESFVSEGIRYCQYYDGILYVSIAHSTYASSAPDNAYIVALDPGNNYKVIWKSQPLVANANNFQVIDNSIITGYGFTAEPDYLYILDRHNGAQADIYPIKTKAYYMYIIDGYLYVRTYDRNLVYQISFG